MKRYHPIQGFKDTINNCDTGWICGMWHAPDLLRRQKPPVYGKHSPVTCSRLKLPVQPGLIRWGTKQPRHRVSQIHSADHQAVRVVVHLTHSVTTDGTWPHRPPPDLPPNSLR